MNCYRESTFPRLTMSGTGPRLTMSGPAVGGDDFFSLIAAFHSRRQTRRDREAPPQGKPLSPDSARPLPPSPLSRLRLARRAIPLDGLLPALNRDVGMREVPRMQHLILLAANLQLDLPPLDGCVAHRLLISNGNSGLGQPNPT